MVKVFFSYSHKDENLRDELEIHLSSLKRQGIIETWHDRRIGAGKELYNEIDSNMESADIILLLISPYFIASDYCYNIEMERAIERHNNGEARVIPVILHPCDWQRAPFGILRATPTDGKPVSKYANIHDAFLSIISDVRQAAEEIIAKNTARSQERKEIKFLAPRKSTELVITGKPRSSNLRVRKEYTDIEKSRFLYESFEYMANFFENSLGELKARNPGIDTEFRRIDANHFNSAIFKNGKLACRCRIWLATDSYSSGEIRYSTATSFNDNSWNESMHVDDDGYVLGLKTMGFQRYGSDKEGILSKEGGAEYYWGILIDSLQ